MWVWTSQSVAIHPRLSSTSFEAAEPTSFGMYAFRASRPSSSVASFHDRQKAAITGEAHCGRSDQGSPAM